MKKSELKNEIKNYIYEILSEVDVDPKSGAVVMKKGTNPNDIKKVTSQGIDVELREEEDSTPDDETIDKQAKAAAKKEKIQGPSKFKVPNSEFEDFKTKLKTLVKKIKAMEKGAEKDKKMAALKQFIKKPELVKAFKERDVKINTGGLIGENENKLNEAQHLDIAAVISQIREFNRGNIDMEHLVKMTLKNLGYKPTSNNIENTESHYLASMTSSETIPQDAQIVRELFDILK